MSNRATPALPGHAAGASHDADPAGEETAADPTARSRPRAADHRPAAGPGARPRPALAGRRPAGSGIDAGAAIKPMQPVAERNRPSLVRVRAARTAQLARTERGHATRAHHARNTRNDRNRNGGRCVGADLPAGSDAAGGNLPACGGRDRGTGPADRGGPAGDKGARDGTGGHCGARGPPVWADHDDDRADRVHCGAGTGGEHDRRSGNRTEGLPGRAYALQRRLCVLAGLPDGNIQVIAGGQGPGRGGMRFTCPALPVAARVKEIGRRPEGSGQV